MTVEEKIRFKIYLLESKKSALFDEKYLLQQAIENQRGITADEVLDEYMLRKTESIERRLEKTEQKIARLK